MLKTVRLMVILTFSALTLSGCMSEAEEITQILETNHNKVEQQVLRLKKHLESGRIRNAKLIRQYADVLKKQKPELSDIIETLAQDATVNGGIYQSFLTRMQTAKARIPLVAKAGAQESIKVSDEYHAIHAAANPYNFNLMLSDPLNVLADMSDGKLAKVRVKAFIEDNTKTAQETGSELVGNPNYGKWQTNSSGGTFWEWYGKYAFFSSMFNSPIGYSSWSTNRRSSYYHDIGRDYYSSPKQRTANRQTEQRVKKSFAKQGKTFQSPYAKTRIKGGFVSKPGKFNSSYASNSLSSYKSNSNTGSTKKSSYYNSRTKSSRTTSYGGK